MPQLNWTASDTRHYDRLRLTSGNERKVDVTASDSASRKKLLGYTDKLTVRAGDRIEFKISVDSGTSTFYDAQLVRLINGDAYSKTAGFKEIEVESPLNGRYEGRKQAVALGSCIVVEKAQAFDSLDELTIAISFLPTTPLS